MKIHEGLYRFNLFVMNEDKTVNSIIAVQIRSYTAGDVVTYRYASAANMLTEEGIKDILGYLNPKWDSDLDLAVSLEKYNKVLVKYEEAPREA